jgi:hypothetical protein
MLKSVFMPLVYILGGLWWFCVIMLLFKGHLLRLHIKLFSYMK